MTTSCYGRIMYRSNIIDGDTKVWQRSLDCLTRNNFRNIGQVTK